MADIATLGIAIDSKQAKSAATDLDKLTAAATKAEGAADNLSGATVRARDAQGKFVGATSLVASGLNTQTQAMNGATAAVRAHTVAANQNAVAAKAASMNVGNLAAQFQDIAVTAAMGMSPLQIALQQGTQISAAFGSQGAAGALSSLGAAFMSVISPVSLLTIGIVAASAALVQYIFSIGESDTKSEEALNKQIVLIGGVTSAWEGAVPALKAYLDQLEAAKNADDLDAATAVAASAQYDVLRAKVSDVGVVFAELISQLDAAGAKQSVIYELNLAFQAFKDGVDAGTAGAAEFQAVQAALAAALPSGVSAIDSFGAAFAALAERIGVASAAAAQFRQQAVQAVMARDSMEKNQPYEDMGPYIQNIPRPESRPKIELEGLPGQYNGNGTLKGAKAPRTKVIEDPFKDITEGAERSLATLRAQQDALGMTADSAARLKYETQLLNQAQQKGIELTPAQRTELMALASTMASVESATAAVKEEAKQAKEQMSFAKDVTGGFMSDLRSGLESGKGFWRSFGDAALNVLDKIVDKIQDDLVDALFSANGGGGGGGGGLFGSLLSLFGGGGGISAGTSSAILGGAVGMFAKGTNFAPGGPAIVGEEGPELVNLPRGAQVIPNHAIARMQAPANSGSYTSAPVFNIDARGAQVGAAEEISAMMDKKLQDFDKGSRSRWLRDREQAGKRNGVR